MVIQEEYRSGSAQILRKLEWLQGNGWDQVWRARGDGDCFYRCQSTVSWQSRIHDPQKLMSANVCIAFTIAYLLRILHSPDPALAANLAFDAIQRALPALHDVGFDLDLVRPHVFFLIVSLTVGASLV